MNFSDIKFNENPFIGSRVVICIRLEEQFYWALSRGANSLNKNNWPRY